MGSALSCAAIWLAPLVAESAAPPSEKTLTTPDESAAATLAPSSLAASSSTYGTASPSDEMDASTRDRKEYDIRWLVAKSRLECE